MMALQFIKRLYRLANKFIFEHDEESFIELFSIFVDLDFDPSELDLLNMYIRGDFLLYEEYMSFFAFQYGIDYLDLRQITENEQLAISSIIYKEEAYNETEKDWIYFTIYKNQIKGKCD